MTTLQTLSDRFRETMQGHHMSTRPGGRQADHPGTQYVNHLADDEVVVKVTSRSQN